MNRFIWRASSSFGASAPKQRKTQAEKSPSSFDAVVIRQLLSREPRGLLRGMALEREFDQTVDQVAVSDARILPHLRIHADRGEPRDGIDLVDVEFRRRVFTQEIDPPHAFAPHRSEALDREFPDREDFALWQL